MQNLLHCIHILVVAWHTIKEELKVFFIGEANLSRVFVLIRVLLMTN